MQNLRFIVPVVAALALSACATSRPSMSYVAPEITYSDAQTMATDAVNFLADPLPPAHTTLILDPPRPKQPASAVNPTDALTAAMTEKLRARGYGISVVTDDEHKDATARKGTALRYLASPLDNGIVLRLQFGGQEATKLYPRTTDGKLMPSGPFMLRGVGQ